ncbi:hypothetical protein SOVF_164850 [Spinacia oleracea]|nr:hypothetical protein SOVF_164850 [Spinacia oleracea]
MQSTTTNNNNPTNFTGEGRSPRIAGRRGSGRAGGEQELGEERDNWDEKERMREIGICVR